MPRRIAVNSLNASTIDIFNVIRQNASYEYQQKNPNEKKSPLKRETVFLLSSAVIFIASVIYFISGMLIF